MTRNRGHAKTLRKRWPTRLRSSSAKKLATLGMSAAQIAGIFIAGRACLRNFFAFIARFAQNTAVFKWRTTITSRSSFEAIANPTAKRYENSAAIPDFSATR